MTSLKRQTQLAQRKKATDITKVSNPASEPTEKTFPIQNFSKPHYRSPTKKLQGCCQMPFLFMKNKLEKKEEERAESKATFITQQHPGKGTDFKDLSSCGHLSWLRRQWQEFFWTNVGIWRRQQETPGDGRLTIEFMKQARRPADGTPQSVPKNSNAADLLFKKWFGCIQGQTLMTTQ